MLLYTHLLITLSVEVLPDLSDSRAAGNERTAMDVNKARRDLADVMALVEDQMRDLRTIKQKQSALTVTATAARGTIEVTVDPRGRLTEIRIDESYLDDNEFSELAGHIIDAAREAAEEVNRRMTELMEPALQRRRQITAMSGAAADLPDFTELMSILESSASDQGSQRGAVNGDDHDEREDVSPTPTVRG